MQVYFISIVIIVFSGVMLSEKVFGAKFRYDCIFNKNLFNNKTLKVSLGVLSVLVGVLLILSPKQPNDLPVIGDIILALLGIIGGLSLVLKSLGKDTYSGEKKFITWVYNFINSNFSIVGLLMIIMGIIHIFFPGVPLL